MKYNVMPRLAAVARLATRLSADSESSKKWISRPPCRHEAPSMRLHSANLGFFDESAFSFVNEGK
jgi:hypothetical protein